MPKARSVVAAIAIVGAGFSVLQLSSWSGQPVVRFVADLLILLIALFAAGCALAAARRAQGRRRSAWICMAMGSSGFAAGQAIWGYTSLVSETLQFQSVADVGYAALPIGAGLALLFLLGDYPRSTRVRVLLDGVIVGGALFGAAWVTLLGTVYAVRVPESMSLALSLAYPVAGIALVTIALLLLVRVPAGDRTMMAMLTVGLVLITIADAAYAYVTAVEGRYYEAISLGYAWGFLAIGGSALVSRQTRRGSVQAQPQMPSRASMWLPFVPVSIAVAVFAPVMLPLLGPLYVVGVITVFAVMIRQYVLLDQNHQLLAEVSDQVMRDPLTGLASRTLFESRLDRAMQVPRSAGRSVAVLLMDVDDFKLVNDSYGHAAGDAILVQFAERLNGTVRSDDTAARLGGDEFAVLMDGDVEVLHTVAQRVVHAFDRAFAASGQDLRVRPSVGLAMSVDGAETTGDELLMQADVAMYAAKKSRSGNLHVYSPEMGQGENSAGVLVAGTRSLVGGRIASRLLTELRHAIDHAELTVFYQPKFDVRAGQIVGVEALVRWPHPRRGLLAPEEFLPLVREHGLMRSLTSLVLDMALDDAAEWYAKGVGVPLAINVFAPSISDTDLPRQLIGALASRSLPPEILTVEITEDLLLEDMAQTRAVFTALRDSGIRIAIDDFGSGYSALWYLRDFQVHEVKLDREFIAPILTQPTSAAIVRAVIDLAHVLGVTPVAEGVENAETAAKLLEYGCDVAQGFYYSPPLPAPAVLDLLTSQQRKQNSSADDHPGANGYPPDGTRRKEIELMQ